MNSPLLFCLPLPASQSLSFYLCLWTGSAKPSHSLLNDYQLQLSYPILATSLAFSYNVCHFLIVFYLMWRRCTHSVCGNTYVLSKINSANEFHEITQVYCFYCPQYVILFKKVSEVVISNGHHFKLFIVVISWATVRRRSWNVGPVHTRTLASWLVGMLRTRGRTRNYVVVTIS